MKTIKLACYKGKTTLYDYLATTILKYSHIELVIDDVSYSSSLRDGGVRSKEINFNTKHWDIFYLDVANTKRLNKFYKFFDKTKNCKYDKLSLFLNLIGIKKDVETKKYNCYEYVARSFNILFEANININLLPNELKKEIIKWK